MNIDDEGRSEGERTKTQQTSSVVQEFIRAVRDKDIEAAAGLFTEDSEIHFGAGYYQGGDEIREWLEDLANRASVYVAASGWEHADLAQTSGEVHFRIWTTRNMHWYGCMTFVVRGEKIVVLTGLTYSKDYGPSEYTTSILEPRWMKDEWQK